MNRLLFGVMLFSVFGFGLGAGAQEAATIPQQPKGTVILRVNQKTHAEEFLTSDQAMNSVDEFHAMAKSGTFKPVSKDHMQGSELDQDAGVSSWHFGWHRPFYGRGWGGIWPVYGGFGGWYNGWNFAYTPYYNYCGYPYYPTYLPWSYNGWFYYGWRWY